MVPAFSFAPSGGEMATGRSSEGWGAISKPPRLREGDRIAVVSVAGVVDRERVEDGIQIVREMGWVPVIWEGCFEDIGGYAGTDVQRARRFQSAWEDTTIRGVWCARGGYGSMRVLPYIDFERLRSRPKVLMGFSDITALHAAIYRNCRMVSFHGPLISTLPETGDTARQWMATLLSGEACQTMSVASAIILRPGKVVGPLFVGNLATLCHLLGTPYAPNLAGHILILEDIGERWHRVDRMFVQLLLSGALKEIGGILLGSFEECGPFPERILRVAEEIGTVLHIPVAAGLPVGHQTDNRTLPTGILAVWDSESRSLRLLDTPTAS